MRTSSTITACLFLFFQALYALTSSGNVFRVADEFEVYFQVESLVDEGRQAIPQVMAMTERVVTPAGRLEQRPVLFGKFGADGLPYAPYGPLTAFLAVPHHLAARGVASALGLERRPLPGGRPWLIVVAGLTSLATATFAALTVAGFFQACLLLGASARRAVWLALLLGAGTALWPYGTSFYAEAFVAAGLIWTSVALLQARRREPEARRGAWLAAAAVLACLTTLIKPNAMVFLPGFLVTVAFAPAASLPARARLVALLAGAIALGGVVHLAYNYERFGTLLDFGHAWGETISGTPRPFALEALPMGLAVLLFSPGKSLFAWAPSMLLVLLVAREASRRHPALLASLGTALAVALVYFGSYAFPEGGYCHGPRFLVPLLPLLLMPLALVPVPRRALALTGVAGFAVAALAVMTSFVQDQTMGADLRGRIRQHYYEQTEPAPGRPWNRYNLSYIPFVTAMRDPEWGVGGPPGAGIDFFPLHLTRARRLLPDMQAIPAWFPPALASWWMLWLVGAGTALWRAASRPGGTAP